MWGQGRVHQMQSLVLAEETEFLATISLETWEKNKWDKEIIVQFLLTILGVFSVFAQEILKKMH